MPTTPYLDGVVAIRDSVKAFLKVACANIKVERLSSYDWTVWRARDSAVTGSVLKMPEAIFETVDSYYRMGKAFYCSY